MIGEQFATALIVGLRAAMPVLVLVAGAALAASVVQALVGFGDPAIGLAFRLIGATAGLAVFGHWTVQAVLDYWRAAWDVAANVLGGGP